MTILQTTPIKPNTKNVPKTESIKENHRKEFFEQFSVLGQRIEKYQAEQGNPEPLSMNEIVAVVKEVRAERYAKQQKQ
jgi:hypothetical protein